MSHLLNLGVFGAMFLTMKYQIACVITNMRVYLVSNCNRFLNSFLSQE